MSFPLRFHTILLGCTLASAVALSHAAPIAVPPATQIAAQARIDAQIPVRTWPREIKLSNATVLVYQPQVGEWTGNRIAFRCALAIKPAGASDETFGVIFASARTKVDKSTRTVILDDLQVTKSDLPTLPDHGAAYAAELQKQFASGVRRVSLDRLRPPPAPGGGAAGAVTLENNPPRVIVSTSPAILVPIDGPPALRAIPGTAAFVRVINTRALILQRTAQKDFFIHVFDGWLFSASIDGPWTQPFLPPAGIDAVAAKINAGHLVDMLDGGPRASPKPSLANLVPAIYTSQIPAELIVFKGAPNFVPVAGTALQWAANTTSDVLVDADRRVYALFAGRWFRAATLAGPWTFVAGNALPPDFAKIPAGSLAGAVLPTVAGTPQAQAAANENAVAQTATVPLTNGPKFVPRFDGAPQYAPIAGTALSYAVNASVPVIQVSADAYYGVVAGVWFTAKKAAGPWTIATSVPQAIYTIPPYSPIHYVTYVRLFDVTPDAVHEGYTPGYLGTAVSASGTVVYGTGYNYASWIGKSWYPAPSTYSVAATPVYNPYVGFTFGFAAGLATPAWTADFLGGAIYHGSYWGGYPCCASTSANVYRGWAGATRGKSAGGAGAVGNTTVGGAAGANAFAGSPNAVPQSNPSAGNVARPYDLTGNALASSQGNSAMRSGAVAPASGMAANASRSAVPENANAGNNGPSTGARATGEPDIWRAGTNGNDHYADASGNVYRNTGGQWQQQSEGGWSNAPGDTAWADQEAQSRANAAVAESSVSVSNTTRFTGAANDGWSQRDAGDGGYSRTLGASGGIGAEYDNYWNTVQDNAFDMWNNGVYGGDVYYGGIGWSGRLPNP